MLGSAAVAMWWDIAPEVRAEWEDWHTREHMPERLAIPGFLRGTRWIASSGAPSYFVLYEAADLGTLTRGPYVERLNNPTPWSRKMMPHHRNMVRSLCRVHETSGRGVAQAIATLRLDQPIAAEALGRAAQRQGVTSAHLLQSQSLAGLPQTTEQKIRGGADREANWVALIGGYDADAVAAASQAAVAGAAPQLYRLSFCLP
jgi:hypothetical protein